MSFINLWALLASALLAPEGAFIENHCKWKSMNASQKMLIRKLDTVRDELPQYSDDELQAWASTDHELLNEIAQQHNIPFTFASFAPGQFGSLSILHLRLAWLHKPAVTTIAFEGIYPVNALLFNHDAKMYKSPKHRYPIVKIETNSGDCICMTVANKVITDAATLSKTIKKISNTLVESNEDCCAVIMPKLSFDGFVDISWLEGLRTLSKENMRYRISSAVEYLKLTCDQEGCSVDAGAGIVFDAISCHAQPLVFDKPFYFWIEREGVSIPLLEAYIDREVLDNIN